MCVGISSINKERNESGYFLCETLLLGHARVRCIRFGRSHVEETQTTFKKIYHNVEKRNMRIDTFSSSSMSVGGHNIVVLGAHLFGLLVPCFLTVSTLPEDTTPKLSFTTTEVHGGGDLGQLVKPAREPGPSRPKPCAPLKNAPRILTVRCSLLALVERKQTVVRDQLFPQKTPGLRLRFSHTKIQYSPLACWRSSCSPPSPNLMVSRPVERTTVHLHVLLRPTSLSATVPRASRAPPSLKGAKLELGIGAPGEDHPQPTKPPPPRLNRPAEL